MKGAAFSIKNFPFFFSIHQLSFTYMHIDYINAIDGYISTEYEGNEHSRIDTTFFRSLLYYCAYFTAFHL